jgi:hypothetical protein
MEGSLAIRILFEDDDGDFHTALLRRNPAGSWRLIGEDDRVIVVDGAAHALTSTEPTSQRPQSCHRLRDRRRGNVSNVVGVIVTRRTR